MDPLLNFISEVKRKSGKERPRIGLFGMGKTNTVILSKLRELGIKTVIRSDADRLPDEISQGSDAVYTGDHSLDDVLEDAIIFSPSVRRERSALALARERGVIFSSDTEMFFGLKPQNVFSVTGSDGKSTVTYFTSRLLSLGERFAEVFPSGNFGIPFASLSGGEASAYVAELSSFNLHYLTPHSTRAAITCITPNHLNWHSSMNEYVSDKLRILSDAEEVVLPLDGGICECYAKAHGAFALFSSKKTAKQMSQIAKAELYISFEGGGILINGKSILGGDDLDKIKGHNIENLMCSIGLAYGLAGDECARRLARDFSGLPHRCQTVGSFGGVSFINSSIDTTPARTATTLSTLDKTVILILGGRTKGVPFTDAIPLIARYAKSLHIYGECQSEFLSELFDDPRTRTIPTTSSDSFKDAFAEAARSAAVGDTVLLSPAATAYGEFRNFEERGEIFCHMAKLYED